MILFALFVRSGLWTPDSTHPTRSERSVLLLLEQFTLLHSNLVFFLASVLLLFELLLSSTFFVQLATALIQRHKSSVMWLLTRIGH